MKHQQFEDQNLRKPPERTISADGSFMLNSSRAGERALHRLDVRESTSAAEQEMRRYFNDLFTGRMTKKLWAVRLLPPLVKQTLKYGPGLRRDSGMSPVELFLDAWSFCRREECWPASYFKYRLYRPERRAFGGRFVDERIGLPVMKHVNDREDVAVLDDKLKFAAACARLGLPHVETVAYLEAGNIVEAQFASPADLPREDLFIKSTNLLCGRGIMRWHYDAGTDRYQHDGVSLKAGELVERVRTMSALGTPVPLWKRARAYVPRLGYEFEREDRKPRPYIMQRELRNHLLMAPFSNGALCTVRVVTARRASAEPQLIVAVLRMPTGASRVDNFAAGGIAAPIDMLSGRLGRAVYKDPRKPDVEAHPDSGQRIEGETLPFWSEVKELALRAHRAFPRVATVGWDVAITTEGAKLIEANPGFCVEVVQMAHGKPLGHTPWPELVMSHAC